MAEKVADTVKAHARRASSGGLMNSLTRFALTAAAMTMGQHMPQFGRRISDPAVECTQTFDIEWVSDTGAGRNLSSLKNLPQQVQQFVGRSDNPVEFSTGGGCRDGKKSVGILGGLADGDELFLLKNCPSALSTGIQVNKHGKPFVWLPNELPFYIKPNMLSKCVIKVPAEARISADRIEENVPIFKESIAVTHALVGTVQGGELKVEGEDELATATSAEQATSSSSASTAAGNTHPLEAELAEEEVVVEVLPEEAAVEEDVSATERLKLEAKSLEHQVSHFPKNPFCSICSIARMTSARVDHTGKKDKTDNLPIPESFGKMLRRTTSLLPRKKKMREKVQLESAQH